MGNNSNHIPIVRALKIPRWNYSVCPEFSARVALNNADMSLRDLKRAATRRASQWMAQFIHWPLQAVQSFCSCSRPWPTSM